MKIALEQISLEVGSLFGPMGADIQDGFTAALKGVSGFIKENRALLRQMIQDFKSIIGPIAKVFIELMKIIANFNVQVAKVFQGLFAGIRQALGMASVGEAKARLDRAKAATSGRTRPTRNTRGGGQSTSAEFIELDAAQKAFSGLGGQAAFDRANAPAQPSNLTYGGDGAGMSIDRTAKEDKEKKKKTDSLESFERLRDQLANAYNQAEMERIKAEYELRKRLQEDMFDMQEFGANRLQKQNLQFLRALAKAEQDRQDTLMDAQLRVAEAAGKIAPSAPLLPSSGGASASSLTSFTSQQLARATQDASRFTGVANMCSESVKAFYKSLGISLPGVTAWADTVRKAGQTMTDWSKLQAGDIVATGRPGDTPHVGVYTGGQNVFHQSRKRGLKAGNYPDLSYFQQQGYFVRPTASAGAPRKVGSNESRDTMAGASVEIAQQNAAISERGGLLTKESTILKDLGRYMQEVYNVPDLTLDNQLLKARNDLLEQGVDENVINYKMRLLELDIQYKDLLREFPKFADAANLTEQDRIKVLAILAQYLDKSKNAEKAKNDETLRGIEIEKTRERDKYIKSLQDEIKLLLIIGDKERKLAEIKAQYGDAKAQEIFNLEKIKKNIEDTRALIDGFVSQTSSDYKGFLKAVISGEDAADALKQFQEGLKDRVLTIFLDFAMAPVEKFLKESLEGLFLPKAPKELKPEEEKAKTGIEGNTVATDKNTTALDNLTTALQGAGATPPTSTVSGGGGGGIFDAANVFGGGGNLTGGIFDTISQQMGGATESLSSFSSHMGKFVDSSVASADAVGSWGDSFNTQLSESLTKATETTNTQGATFQESLGKAVGAIGIAAGAIMGIAAGISQIKKGGTGNTLMGIGSIMASVGGAIGGFTKLAGANGGVAGGGWKPFPVSAFANGGMVKGPTLGLVGEGKYNEAIVPLPDGRSIPVQMRGAGGSGSRELLANQAQSRPSPSVLSMSFQSTTINGVEYVDRAQLEAAMEETRRAASREGANKGAILAIDRLANSPSSRRRAGIR